MKCEKCGGQGFLYSPERSGPSEKVTCRVCKGTGIRTGESDYNVDFVLASGIRVVIKVWASVDNQWLWSFDTYDKDELPMDKREHFNYGLSPSRNEAFIVAHRAFEYFLEIQEWLER